MPHDASRKLVWAERLVPASPDRIFDLLADPTQHPAIDGSGSVVAPRTGGPARLSLGAKFSMDMRIVLPYRMPNRVVEFVENERIAWRPAGRQVWRYILSPAPGGTLVREEFDYSRYVGRFALRPLKVPAGNERWIERTLDNLARHFGAPI